MQIYCTWLKINRIGLAKLMHWACKYLRGACKYIARGLHTCCTEPANILHRACKYIALPLEFPSEADDTTTFWEAVFSSLGICDIAVHQQEVSRMMQDLQRLVSHTKCLLELEPKPLCNTPPQVDKQLRGVHFGPISHSSP